ncbi:hypothetical protein FAY30_26540 (plasmid) [Bacillus sp. S3]|uniref:hypothetical protein n=1 Tax=Bacillus sp. S3 TaxID=486398 RepID=UPI00118A6A5C|nr:hypothetical protein [Bacillus sp. S3]QCJ45500.1 hypothetical protein FAY30_26540 [Bacillus sp. S3]
MNKKLIIIGPGIIFVSLVTYIILGPELFGKNELALEATKKDVLNEVKKTKEYADKTSKWMGENGEDTDIGFLHPPEEHKKNEDPKLDVLKYFIAGLLAKDIDIFLSSFNPETVSKDMYQSKVEDKTKVAKEIMNRISREGQIKDVQYKIEKGAFTSGVRNKLSVTLTYKDNRSAKVKLDIIPLGDAHQHENKESIYVITTSAWKIIEQIEKST